MIKSGFEHDIITMSFVVHVYSLFLEHVSRSYSTCFQILFYRSYSTDLILQISDSHDLFNKMLFVSGSYSTNQ